MTTEPKSCHLPSRELCSSGHREECDWQRQLPAEWCDAVDAPLYFRHFSAFPHYIIPPGVQNDNIFLL